MKEGWEIKKLGDCCNIQTGKLDANARVENGKYPFYTCDSQPYRIDTYAFDAEAILISGNGSLVGHVNYYKGKFNAYQRTYVLTEFSSFYIPYLIHFLKKYIRPYIMKNKKGGCIPYITLPILKNFLIPCPPLPEQESIVAELDCLSSIIEKQKEQLKELDNLAQSIFYTMFGDPVSNNYGWETLKLSEGCDEIGDGLHGTPNYDSNGKIAFINGVNMVDGKIQLTDKTQFVNEVEAKKHSIKMGTNTVLLSINGTLGKTAIYRNEDIILGKSACYCNIKENILDVIFLERLMRTDSFKVFLENNSSKSTIKNVGLKAIRNYRVITPPLTVQQDFASKIEAIEKQKKLIKQSIAETETLFNSRMDYYFN